MKKLEYLNGHYLREADNSRLVDLIAPKIEEALDQKLADEDGERLLHGMPGLKTRAKDLSELAEHAVFYVRERPIPLNEKAEKLLDEDGRTRLAKVGTKLATLDSWAEDALEAAIQEIAKIEDVKLGKVAQPLRAALTGSTISPGIFEVMAILGKVETLDRLRDVAPWDTL